MVVVVVVGCCWSTIRIVTIFLGFLFASNFSNVNINGPRNGYEASKPKTRKALLIVSNT